LECHVVYVQRVRFFHVDSSCQETPDGRCPDGLDSAENRATYHLAMSLFCFHRVLLRNFRSHASLKLFSLRP
jgi:hypothetical protein